VDKNRSGHPRSSIINPTYPQESGVAKSDKKPLLEVKNLKTYFYTEDGTVRAVDGVNFEVYPGEVLGLVGESGCGKSVTSLSIMRLLAPPGKVVAGEIFLDGESLLDMSENEMMKVRGNRISMIFQQPQTALNPVFKVNDQIAEVLDIHQDFGREAGKRRAVELLKMVGIPDAERRAEAYPHELSGGMAQRVMIAMALACVPELLIADEPTTALDVTIQAQILDLMRDLRERMGTSVILITHDLGVIAEMAERVAVMYAGEIVEQADVNSLFDQPLHPYTQGLIGSIPVLGQIKERLDVIPGSVPNLVNLPPGCRFAPRCTAREKFGLTICADVKPDLQEAGTEHLVRCWLYQNDEEHGHKAPLKAR
jgi:oligopeptide/dipeptide ABC transporter ATP-binding protein